MFAKSSADFGCTLISLPVAGRFFAGARRVVSKKSLVDVPLAICIAP
jgi:hypothetical protein